MGKQIFGGENCPAADLVEDHISKNDRDDSRGARMASEPDSFYGRAESRTDWYLEPLLSPTEFCLCTCISRTPIQQRDHYGRQAIGSVRLSPTPEGMLVQDLGSTNGTYVNGRRVSQWIARAGDELRLDCIRFLIERPVSRSQPAVAVRVTAAH